MSVYLSDSYRNDKATDCKASTHTHTHKLTYQGLTNNWDVMFTERLKVRKGNIQRISEKEKCLKIAHILGE